MRENKQQSNISMQYTMQYMENALWHGVKTHVGANLNPTLLRLLLLMKKCYKITLFLYPTHNPLYSLRILINYQSKCLSVLNGQLTPFDRPRKLLTMYKCNMLLSYQGLALLSASLLLDVQRWAKDWLSLLLNLLLQVMSQCKAFTLCKSPSVDWPGVEQWQCSLHFKFAGSTSKR